MKTVFIRALEAPVDKKSEVLLAAINASSAGGTRFEVELESFLQVPRAPLAYWVSDKLRSVFSRFAPFENESLGRSARKGLSTDDDFRFLRCHWEVPALAEATHRWPLIVKGGKRSPYYSAIHVVIDWASRGAQLKAFTIGRYGNAGKRVFNEEFYFRPGLTWPLRGIQFSASAVPEGCVFSGGGKMAFTSEGELASALAVFNSRSFDMLIAVFAGKVGGVQYESGVIGRIPFPSLSDSVARFLGQKAVAAWRIRRADASGMENAHAFILPAILQGEGDTLQVRAVSSTSSAAARQQEFAAIQTELDDHVFDLYEIPAADRQGIGQGTSASGDPEDSSADYDEDDGDEEEEAAVVDSPAMVASLLSWTLGVAFGRFDVRLATGERAAPPEPEPFDPLSVCSPGMLTGDDGLPLAAPPAHYPLTFPTDGILVDDPGHPRNLARAVRSVFDTVFDDANARWHEAAELLGVPDLRTWFARDFFEPHIKRYSKSRRKAPIYWQLATASGSYSVWLYIHRATSDTLFRVLNDFVGPKLDHEKAKLDGLTQEAGPNPSAVQRREIEQQEDFVGELQALKTEVARVAPLWRPNLDDGVILNFAPLWRLVPESRSWQGECKKAWDKLQSGDYDWAHLAMHLWPERVVPKCIDDRSLAIAHGLEDVFWGEDESGTWRKSRVDEATVHKLIAARTSSTVKAALKDLLAAPTATASKGRKANGRSAAPRKTAAKPAPAAPRAATSDVAVDEATISAVKDAIASMADGVSKADVLAATGLSDADWNKAIAVLLDRGDVSRTGQKRGTRYHADPQGEDG